MHKAPVGRSEALGSPPCLFPRRRVPAWRLWGIGLLILFSVSWGWAHEGARLAPAKMVRQSIEGRALELALVNQSGQPLTLKELRGKVVLLLGADLASWAFLTGHPQAVQEVWQAFGLTVKQRAEGVVDHPAWTLLIDQEGMVRYRYLGGLLEVETILEDMRTLWQG